MGANIGTTVTGWLVSSVEWAKALSPANIAPVAVMIGVIVMLTGKRRSTKDISSIIVGFGILFIGITTMSDAVEPLQQSEAFCNLFVTLGHSPFLGIVAGALVTAVIQSSSASVGILQSLAAAGLVPFNAAVYIIMGQNIGTCVTAIMSSIGAKKTAKTAAVMHLLFNIIGTIIFSVVAIVFFKVINPGFGEALITQTEISTVHTILISELRSCSSRYLTGSLSWRRNWREKILTMWMKDRYFWTTECWRHQVLRSSLQSARW